MQGFVAFSGLNCFGQKHVFGFLRIFTQVLIILFFCLVGGGGRWERDNYAHKDLRHGKLEMVLGTASSEGKPLAPLQTLILDMYWNMSYLD